MRPSFFSLSMLATGAVLLGFSATAQTSATKEPPKMSKPAYEVAA